MWCCMLAPWLSTQLCGPGDGVYMDSMWVSAKVQCLVFSGFVADGLLGILGVCSFGVRNKE